MPPTLAYNLPRYLLHRNFLAKFVEWKCGLLSAPFYCSFHL